MAFKKNDRGKSRLDLVPPRALELVGHLLAHGAREYSVDGWKECQDPLRYIAAGLRHYNKHLKGEFVDPATSLPHLASVACNALFALELYLMGRQDKTMAGVYFAVIQRRGPKARKGKVLRRFSGNGKQAEAGDGAYERALSWMRTQITRDVCVGQLGLRRSYERYTIKTVGSREKVGSTVSLV